jgi:hypothetical protein
MRSKAAITTDEIVNNQWTKACKNIQAADGVAITSHVEKEKAKDTLKEHCPSIDNDEGRNDEETRDNLNSPHEQVPLPHLEDWSTALHSLIKGKKKFQHQVCCDPSLSHNFSKFSFRT